MLGFFTVALPDKGVAIINAGDVSYLRQFNDNVSAIEINLKNGSTLYVAPDQWLVALRRFEQAREELFPFGDIAAPNLSEM